MDYIERIISIEARARAVNLTLHEACRASGVPYHAVLRWKRGQVNPTVRVLNRDLDKLDRHVAGVERSIFERLAPRFNPVAAAE